MSNNSTPVLCKGGCGFYGSPDQDNYCSVCYKKINNIPIPPTHSTISHSEEGFNLFNVPNMEDIDLDNLDLDNLDDDVIDQVIKAYVYQNMDPSDFDEDEEVDEDIDPAFISFDFGNMVDGAEIDLSGLEDMLDDFDDVKSENEIEKETDKVEESESVTVENVGVSEGEQKNTEMNKQKRLRCAKEGCRKRLGLTSITCRCEKKFCNLHRYAEQHDCEFEYKKHAQETLSKNTPRKENILN
eukprot:TRINITY_DN2272_c0_g1_i2.p1 TRINITY_DN2272_c0_g1~~TRINITY_DN2272_c0_g1_i2.p1  ORF type:complete len:241 (+),score=68.69 TRINITY_DN2272_c0_g1_i2:42-764(+)